MNDAMTNGLHQTWVRVVDQQGRAHLEARWLDASYVPTSTVTAA